MQEKTHYWKLQNLLKPYLKTRHARIILLFFLVGLTFLPTWLHTLISGVFGGNSTIVMNVGFLYLGLKKFWERREELQSSSRQLGDRTIGYIILMFGAAGLPLYRESISLQALFVVVMLIGMAWSSFGRSFFKRFAFPVVMLLASVYPNYAFLSSKIWYLATGPYLLENLMARLGGVALQMIGQPAVFEERWIALPGGFVEVGPGCSGFGMAFEVAGFSLILGLILAQSWRRIALVMSLGVLLALLFNIPRIMLLTLAAIYWGKASFDFWHGLWGGQIFSAIMFTIYYYIAMTIYSRKPILSK